MKKVVFFVIVATLLSLLSSCAVHTGHCPGVAQIDSFNNSL